jgi:hypothetical protein
MASAKKPLQLLNRRFTWFMIAASDSTESRMQLDGIVPSAKFHSSIRCRVPYRHQQNMIRYESGWRRDAGRFQQTMFKAMICSRINMSYSPADSDLHRISTDKGIEIDQNGQHLNLSLQFTKCEFYPPMNSICFQNQRTRICDKLQSVEYFVIQQHQQ